ncbi:ArsR family transcriptional regulator [Altericroceibacterium spongiae]|uniref:ArsR family transcriptional regulator n=1 Tax=Altericroceibacterium spongiae TaxID=2320269 RepID=A0A420EP64_9SPHN|nr:metalloregulator ArsR/SmtB family transcription factor [Altericroceibacterium spongiae]RKF22467.1 ArsR family transcriptional regulator [Altericroceibacterium spongiae]
MSGAPIDSFKALAHPTRFAVLQSLIGKERNVGEIEEATGIAQPGLSQQLAVLRNSRLVTTRRDAKLVYYSLNTELFVDLAAILAQFGPVDDANIPPAVKRRFTTGVATFARMG